MPHKILIVDDEPDLQDLIRQKFRKKIRANELEFVGALNGVEALQLLTNNNGIDLILTDINMPHMDGLTLLGKIRELNNPLLKTVIVSAYGDMENIRTAMNRGAFDFVTKPINFVDLEITIEKTLQELSTLKSALETRTKLLAIQQELEIARSIQLSILPNNSALFSNQKEFEINASMETAREVGGDLYDFFMIDENRLGFFIGDVSGKGIPAAIFMAVSKTCIRSTALRGLPVNECLQAVNSTLVRESVSNVYVTAVYGILNIRTGELDLCNAGHNPPYLIKKNGDIEQLKTVDGIPLGFVDHYAYGEQHVLLQPGETIFLYTDGVIEAMDQFENDFSEARMEQVLRQVGASSLPVLNQGVLDEVRRFTGGVPQSDDVTVFSLKYLCHQGRVV